MKKSPKTISVDKVKPSLTSRNLAIQVAKEELKKTDDFVSLENYYLELMNQLLVDGIPRNDVCTIGAKIIIDKKEVNKKEKKGVVMKKLKI